MYGGIERRSSITLTHKQLEELSEMAAEKGGAKVLEHLGLSLDKEGRKDVQDMMDFVGVWRTVKRTTLRTFVTVIIVAALGLVSLGFFVKTGHPMPGTTKQG